MARYIAKNLVAAKLAERCEVQLAYSIGVALPVSIYIDTFGTSRLANDELVKLVNKEFDLTPSGIIKDLNLKTPIYSSLGAYGHFGRDGLPWEETNRVDNLLQSLKMESNIG